MKLNEEQKTICSVFSKRDKLGWVHCNDCPMVLDKRQSACLAVVSEDDARRFFDWSGHPFPKLEGGSGNADKR